MSKMEELRWVRIFTPLHIPTYLVEQIKKRDYTVEDFYKYHGSTCVVKQDGKDCLNPFSHLYVLVNPDHLTHCHPTKEHDHECETDTPSRTGSKSQA